MTKDPKVSKPDDRVDRPTIPGPDEMVGEWKFPMIGYTKCDWKPNQIDNTDYEGQ